MPTKTFVVVALLGAATPALAHMKMIFPAPLVKDPNTFTGPMTASEFPCKGGLNGVTLGQGEAASQVTWAPGAAVNFTLTGEAFHGGGSCQASLSYDGGKTFTVIHSFIGSCPKANGDTNYNIAIPSDAPTQDNVLFAWSWFSEQAAQGEMYMNCAVVDIAGGSSKRDVEETVVEKRDTAFSARPNLFVANIGGCATLSDIDIVFPNPGPDVDRNIIKAPGKAGIYKNATDCADPNNTGGGTPGPIDSGSDSGSGSDSATTSAATGTSAVSTGATATSTSIPGGAFVTVEPGSPTETTETTSAAATTSTTTTSSKAAAKPTTLTTNTMAATTSTAAVTSTSAGSTTPTASTGSGTSETFAAGTACTDEGAWNCIGGTSFQRCASGIWSAVIDMASGTTCSPGVSDNLVMFRKRGGPRILAEF